MSYSRGRHWKDCGSNPTQAKGYWNAISIHKPGMIGHNCDFSYVRDICRRIMVPDQPGQKVRCYLKTKKDWRHGSSGRVLAQQV
jgi:hypothetical protein